MTWARTVEKFHWLSEPFADSQLRGSIVAAVEDLDGLPLSRLLGLLSQVAPQAVFPATLPGIQ
jgi:2-methylcitrate dehydratase